MHKHLLLVKHSYKTTCTSKLKNTHKNRKKNHSFIVLLKQDIERYFQWTSTFMILRIFFSHFFFLLYCYSILFQTCWYWTNITISQTKALNYFYALSYTHTHTFSCTLTHLLLHTDLALYKHGNFFFFCRWTRIGIHRTHNPPPLPFHSLSFHNLKQVQLQVHFKLSFWEFFFFLSRPCQEFSKRKTVS